ncbi:hypothetical protein L3Q82_015431 [Scortum barcoo]|uniref:Uncharacterized protein n=1 Tax=Scortum barcoo TaxID=214431 RepID=A0ACB8VTL3_9TELE|nr:hypothetical protein L3Q82_015431 [Scortum barcoo]
MESPVGAPYQVPLPGTPRRPGGFPELNVVLLFSLFALLVEGDLDSNDVGIQAMSTESMNAVSPDQPDESQYYEGGPSDTSSSSSETADAPAANRVTVPEPAAANSVEEEDEDESSDSDEGGKKFGSRSAKPQSPALPPQNPAYEIKSPAHVIQSPAHVLQSPAYIIQSPFQPIIPQPKALDLELTHSTETALVKVTNDLLTASDRKGFCLYLSCSTWSGTPSYLNELITPYHPTRVLLLSQNAGCHLLVVPRVSRNSRHWRNECPVLKKKMKTGYLSAKSSGAAATVRSGEQASAIAAVQAHTKSSSESGVVRIPGQSHFSTDEIDPGYLPFVSDGYVSLVGELVKQQKNDPTLRALYNHILPEDEVESAPRGYFLQDDLLVRKWVPQGDSFVDTPSRTHLIEHDIDVGDAQPIRQHFYRMSPDRRRYLEAERIKALFERLAWAALTINLAKCDFAKATVTYLGKVVGQGQVRPVRAKVLAIDQFPVPTTKKELSRFLGMAGYYRGFWKDFSTVAAPLTSLLSSKAKFVWSPGGRLIVVVIRPMTVVSSADLMMVLELWGGHSVNREYSRGLSTQPWGRRCSESQGGGCGAAHPHSLGSARQEVQDPVTEGAVEPEVSELGDELGGHDGVES